MHTQYEIRHCGAVNLVWTRMIFGEDGRKGKYVLCVRHDI